MTAAAAFLLFMLTLIYMQVFGLVPNQVVFEAFKTAGTSTMSFLFGVLVNTRVPANSPALPAAKTDEPTPAPKN